MKKTAAHVGAVALVTATLILGGGVGTAIASGVFAASASPGEAPQPVWKQNNGGLTYGSALDATSSANEPDLIQADATNGKTGYVLKADLDKANGAAAAATFKTIEEALEWQETEGRGNKTIPVYDVDGVTRIGEFVVYGTEYQPPVDK